MPIKLTIRKAFKIACELKEKITPTTTVFNSQTQYAVDDSLGSFEEVVAAHLKSLEDAQSKVFHGYKTSQTIRNLISSANTKPLAYADNETINDLIAKQNLLKTLLLSIPAENTVVLDKRNYESLIKTRKEQIEQPQVFGRVDQRITIKGVTTELMERYQSHRLDLRAQLEHVTGQLAYANITETVEISDSDLKVLKDYQIPV